MAEDPRQVRSRLALTRALLKMLWNEPLSSINVAALCLEAGVHRTTFYGHASSIEEFAVDVIAREVDAIATIDRADGDLFLPYTTAMIDLLDQVASRRDVYRTILKSQWGGALRTKLDSLMQYRVLLALQFFSEQDGVEVPEYREEAVAFVSGGIVGTIVLWALSDDTESDDWTTRMQALMPVWWPIG